MVLFSCLSPCLGWIGLHSPTRGAYGITGRISSDSCLALAIEEAAVSSNGAEVTSGVSFANIERITAANSSASVGS